LQIDGDQRLIGHGIRSQADLANYGIGVSIDHVDRVIGAVRQIHGAGHGIESKQVGIRISRLPQRPTGNRNDLLKVKSGILKIGIGGKSTAKQQSSAGRRSQ